MVVKNIICALLVFLLFPAPMRAEEEAPPQVLMFGINDRPFAGSTWILTLLIAHDEPRQVDALAPPFTGSLLLEQVSKTPRLRNPATGQTFSGNPSVGMQGGQETIFERWTAIEYRFLLYSPGAISFDSFTVITPAGRIETEPFELNVQSPAAVTQTQRFQLAWTGMPGSLASGESVVFGLRINNWNPLTQIPDSSFFLPAAPRGHILESWPVSMEDTAAGVVLRLHLIPLGAGHFALERRSLTHGSQLFEIPALRVPVSGSAPAASGSGGGALNADDADGGAFSEEEPPAIPFPARETAALENPRLYNRHKEEYGIVYGTALNLWERGYYANALAVLRQNERDRPAGALFAAVRIAAEQNLGISASGNERMRRAFPFLGRRSRTAVLKETPYRNIPDEAGEIIGIFREGQPALVPIIQGGASSQQRGNWIRVIANDSSGASGWVPNDSAVFY